jgi:hypothetical protein
VIASGTFPKAVLKPPHSKRWRADPAPSHLANHIGLRRQIPQSGRRRRFRLARKVALIPTSPKAGSLPLRGIAPALQDTLRFAQRLQTSRGVWTAARSPPLSPGRGCVETSRSKVRTKKPLQISVGRASSRAGSSGASPHHALRLVRRTQSRSGKFARCG